MAPSVWGRRPGFLPRLPLVPIALLLLGTVAFGFMQLQPSAAPLRGRAQAIDGDTLRLGYLRVRLLGLDAPELDQTCHRPDGTEWPCGAEARAALASRLSIGPVECARYGRDAYGRTLGRCAAGGADLGANLVRSGWAISNDEYLREAFSARGQRLGIWSGQFDQPVDWRRSHGAEQPGLWQSIRNWFQ